MIGIRMKKNNIVAIIPARGGSKSIPHKNIINFCGKPLVAWSIEQALASDLVDNVYVSTDDPKIARISKKYGSRVIRRPRTIAGDTSSSEEALLHAILQIEKKAKIDLVVFLQATSPIREKRDIDMAIEKALREKLDSLFSVTTFEDLTVWENINGVLNSLTFDYKNRRRRQDRAPLYLENGSIYIVKPSILKEYHNRLGGKIGMYEMDRWKYYEIDNPGDLEICEYFMKNKILKEDAVPKMKNIKLIVYDCDGVLTDNKVTLTKSARECLRFNRSDGAAMAAIKKLGLGQVIMTTEQKSAIEKRADKLHVPAMIGVMDKKKALLEYCKKCGINLKDVAYLGNDINDLDAMKLTGWPLCPLDAFDEIKAISKIVLTRNGGDGVVRELFNYIKKGKNG